MKFYDDATAVGIRFRAGGVAAFQTSSLTAKAHPIKTPYPVDEYR
jgi:hypothetical protein